MSKLTLYILREFIVPLFYCLVGFIGIYILFELFGSFSRLLGSDLSFRECVLYFGGYLSPFFHYLASAAMMLATLYTMWNFCRHSELTAMRASGISLFAIVRPLLFCGLLMGAFVAWVSEWYMPEYAQWAKRLKTERFDSDDAAEAEGFTFRNTRCNRTWTVRGEASRDCSFLSDVFVTQDRSDGSRLYSMTAEKARYLDGEWWFFKTRLQHYDINARPCASPTPALDALEIRPFLEYRERPEDIRMQNCDPRLISVRGKLRYIRINKDLNEEGRESLMYDAWAQALAPLSCIIVMLLSIPAGVTSGRQSVFAGILGAVGLFFAYHGFNVGCMVLAKSSLMPSVAAAVVPILIFLSLGVFFFFNSMRSTLCLFGIYAALFVFYVAAAALFVSKLEMRPLAAHITAFPAPLIAAVLCTFRFRLRA